MKQILSDKMGEEGRKIIAEIETIKHTRPHCHNKRIFNNCASLMFSFANCFRRKIYEFVAENKTRDSESVRRIFRPFSSKAVESLRI